MSCWKSTRTQIVVKEPQPEEERGRGRAGRMSGIRYTGAIGCYIRNTSDNERL